MRQSRKLKPGECPELWAVERPAEVKEIAASYFAAGADIIGTNCGNGMGRMIEIVKAMRAVAPEVPILVHANAGLPKNIDGVDTFPETPEDMARQVSGLIAAGANIIGGCCGTTPAHIRAMKAVLAGCRA